MGTDQLTDTFDDMCIRDEGSEERKKKKRKNTTGRLKKIGFDQNDLNIQFSTTLNRDGFASIAEQQLRSIRMECDDQSVYQMPLMKSFNEELKLEPRVWKSMNMFGYTDPLPVQQAVIPYLVNTPNDMMIGASTGSGKTYAFILPIIDYIIKAKNNLADKSPNRKAPYAIIVAPTRELVIQLAMETQRLVVDSYLVKVAWSVGDMIHQQKDKNLEDGADILFLTVGRLYSYFVDRKDFGVTRLKTDNLKYIVIDEADRVLEDRIKRRKNDGSELAPSHQILKEFIVDDLSEAQGRKDFRVILLSATLNHNIRELRALVMPSFIKIQVGTKHVLSTVRQDFVEIIDDGDKDVKLEEFTSIFHRLAERYNQKYDPTILPKEGSAWKMGRTIIFVNNKRDSARINRTLTDMHFMTGFISSELSGRQRYQNFDNMLKGRIDILVATDLMSRGINISELDFVINYDFPSGLSSDEYIHRVGRCGRVGNTGRSITFFNPKFDWKAAPDLIEGCRAVGREPPEMLIRCVNQRSPKNNSPRNVHSSQSTTFPDRYGQRYPSGSGSSDNGSGKKNGYYSAY